MAEMGLRLLVSLLSSVDELARHVVTFFLYCFLAAQEVGEEENFQHDKDNEEFDEYDEPKYAARGHRLEAVDVEAHHPEEDIGFSHVVALCIHAV
jgi:hypothetical protein